MDLPEDFLAIAAGVVWTLSLPYKVTGLWARPRGYFRPLAEAQTTATVSTEGFLPEAGRNVFGEIFSRRALDFAGSPRSAPGLKALLPQIPRSSDHERRASETDPVSEKSEPRSGPPATDSVLLPGREERSIITSVASDGAPDAVALVPTAAASTTASISHDAYARVTVKPAAKKGTAAEKPPSTSASTFRGGSGRNRYTPIVSPSASMGTTMAAAPSAAAAVQAAMFELFNNLIFISPSQDPTAQCGVALESKPQAQAQQPQHLQHNHDQPLLPPCPAPAALPFNESPSWRSSAGAIGGSSSGGSSSGGGLSSSLSLTTTSSSESGATLTVAAFALAAAMTQRRSLGGAVAAVGPPPVQGFDRFRVHCNISFIAEAGEGAVEGEEGEEEEEEEEQEDGREEVDWQEGGEERKELAQRAACLRTMVPGRCSAGAPALRGCGGRTPRSQSACEGVYTLRRLLLPVPAAGTASASASALRAPLPPACELESAPGTPTTTPAPAAPTAAPVDCLSPRVPLAESLRSASSAPHPQGHPALEASCQLLCRCCGGKEGSCRCHCSRGGSGGGADQRDCRSFRDQVAGAGVEDRAVAAAAAAVAAGPLLHPRVEDQARDNGEALGDGGSGCGSSACQCDGASCNECAAECKPCGSSSSGGGGSSSSSSPASGHDGRGDSCTPSRRPSVGCGSGGGGGCGADGWPSGASIGVTFELVTPSPAHPHPACCSPCSQCETLAPAQAPAQAPAAASPESPTAVWPRARTRARTSPVMAPPTLGPALRQSTAPRPSLAMSPGSCHAIGPPGSSPRQAPAAPARTSATRQQYGSPAQRDHAAAPPPSVSLARLLRPTAIASPPSPASPRVARPQGTRRTAAAAVKSPRAAAAASAASSARCGSGGDSRSAGPGLAAGTAFSRARLSSAPAPSSLPVARRLSNASDVSVHCSSSALTALSSPASGSAVSSPRSSCNGAARPRVLSYINVSKPPTSQSDALAPKGGAAAGTLSPDAANSLSLGLHRQRLAGREEQAQLAAAAAAFEGGGGGGRVRPSYLRPMTASAARLTAARRPSPVPE